MTINRNLSAAMKRVLLISAIFMLGLNPSIAMAKCSKEMDGVSDREVLARLTSDADFVGYVFREEDQTTDAHRDQAFLIIRSLKNTTGISKFLVPYVCDDSIIAGSARKHLTIPVGGFGLVFLKYGSSGFQVSECLEATRSEIDEISLNRLVHEALQSEKGP